MSTCEELYADILLMNASILVDQAGVTLANANLMAHQTQKALDQLNYMMQGCGTPPMAKLEDTEDPVAPEAESVAETRMRMKVCEAINGYFKQQVEDARAALEEAEKALDDLVEERDAREAE